VRDEPTVPGPRRDAGRLPRPRQSDQRHPAQRVYRRLAGARGDASSTPQILSISAHWYLPGSRVTIADPPRTIHDFGGSRSPCSNPARGSPKLAEADIPVVQLGIDETLTAEEHFDLARRLNPLRGEGVLVLGSGNVVHNLHAYAWGRHPVEPYEWAMRFETQLRALITKQDFRRVAAYDGLVRDAALAVPTPEHFLPLLYVLAQWKPDEPINFPVDGFDGGSVSMLGVRLG
jgi:4,5-DOPA dioxygenase extradiol